MERSRGAVVTVVAVVAVVTLLSGPLVGIDLTTEPDEGLNSGAGTGNATVRVTDFPEAVSISEGRYGAQQYFLRVPDATVDVTDIDGQPFLVYDVDVTGGDMYFGTTTTAFLDASYEGTNTLSIEQQAFEESDLTRDRYNVTVSVLLRSDGTERVIKRERFVTEVQR